MVDEIWVASNHLRQVLENAGLRNIHLVPCPVDTASQTAPRSEPQSVLAGVPALQLLLGSRHSPEIVPFPTAWLRTAGGRKSETIVSVLNPHDRRKDLRTLLTGFAGAVDACSNPPILVLKLVIDNVTTRMSDVAGILVDGLKVPETGFNNVIVVGEQLSAETLTQFYGCSDYYLTVSRAEGQNLPLIEAMLCGCVAIAPSHTAMADYISPDTAVVIPSRLKRAIPESNAFGYDGLFWHQADPDDVSCSIKTAIALAPQRRAEIATDGRRHCVDLYSGRVVANRLLSRMQGHL
jgi:glycosyltransferase involved in cell wall biosynthesis